MRFDPQSNYVAPEVAPVAMSQHASQPSGQDASVVTSHAAVAPVSSGWFKAIGSLIALGLVSAMVWAWIESNESSIAGPIPVEPTNAVDTQLAANTAVALQRDTPQHHAETNALIPSPTSQPDDTTRRITRSRQEYAKGRALLVMGRYAQAAEFLIEAVELDPAFADARYHLGLAQVNLGDYQSASIQQAALIELNPNLANLLGNLVHHQPIHGSES